MKGKGHEKTNVLEGQKYRNVEKETQTQSFTSAPDVYCVSFPHNWLPPKVVFQERLWEGRLSIFHFSRSIIPSCKSQREEKHRRHTQRNVMFSALKERF